MEEFGNYLKSHREKKGIRLEEIASITKIHLHSLELLESGRLEKLPPEPFIRGFITAYAKYVGLNSKETMDKYLSAAGLPTAEEPEEAAPISPANPSPIPNRPQMARPPMSTSSGAAASEVLGKFQLPSWPKLVTAAGVFFVAGISIFLIQVGKNAETPTQTAAIPTQVEMLAEPAPLEGGNATADNRHDTRADTRTVAANPPAIPLAPPVVAAPVAVAPATNPVAIVPTPPVTITPTTDGTQKPHQVEIEGSERTWVKVVIDGEAPVEFFLAPGKKAQYSAQQKFKVVLGNSTKAKVNHNGQEVEGKRFMGTIKSFRFPANAQFPQDVPKAAEQASPSETEKKETE